MPGLWTLSSLASDIERNYKLRHPKPSHFRVRQHKGILDRMLGTRDDRWWIAHKHFPTLFFGPYASRLEAQQALPLVVIMLELANPKLKPERKAHLLSQMKQRAAQGQFGEAAQREIEARSFLSAMNGNPASQTPSPPTSLPRPAPTSREAHKKCPYCAEWIRLEAIVCRYCGRDLPAHQ